MIDEHSARRALGRQLPELTLRTVRPIEQGWACFVLDVNGRWIFRFPRRTEARRDMERALRYYPFLARRVPVPIPEHRYVARSSRGRLRFVGYAKLRGYPLPTRQLRGERANRWAATLAAVLRALDRISVAAARKGGIPVVRPETERRWRAAQYRRFQRTVWPLLRPAERDRDRVGWERLLADPTAFRSEQRVVHGDLWPSHVLVRSAPPWIGGILDWEDARVSDPASNLAAMPTADGFARRVLELWRGRDDALWERSRWRAHAAFGSNVEHWDRLGEAAEAGRWLRAYRSTIA